MQPNCEQNWWHQNMLFAFPLLHLPSFPYCIIAIPFSICSTWVFPCTHSFSLSQGFLFFIFHSFFNLHRIPRIVFEICKSCSLNSVLDTCRGYNLELWDDGKEGICFGNMGFCSSCWFSELYRSKLGNSINPSFATISCSKTA